MNPMRYGIGMWNGKQKKASCLEVARPDRGRAHSSGSESLELYELDVPTRGPVTRPVFALAGVAARPPRIYASDLHDRAQYRPFRTLTCNT